MSYYWLLAGCCRVLNGEKFCPTNYCKNVPLMPKAFHKSLMDCGYLVKCNWMRKLLIQGLLGVFRCQTKGICVSPFWKVTQIGGGGNCRQWIFSWDEFMQRWTNPSYPWEQRQFSLQIAADSSMHPGQLEYGELMDEKWHVL